MKVCPNPETLALYAGEELDASERTRVATHIIECSTCGALIAELQSDRELLQAHPDIPEDAIQEVHRRVMSQLPSPDRCEDTSGLPPLLRVWPCFALNSTLVRRQPAAQTIVSSERHSAPPGLTELSPELQTTPKVQSRPASKTRRHPAQSSDAELIAALDQLFETEPPAAVLTDSEVVITMLTEDPNVTIILLADSTGETE